MRKNIGLYRGKTYNNAWIEGNLIIESQIYHYIYTNGEKHKVIPESIGECTNLTDKKNNLVFEGDIVKFIHKGKPTSNKNVPGSIHFFSIGEPYSRNYEIKYVNTYVNYGLRFINGSIHFPCKQSTLLMYDCEIIGNIHDNPELLKRGAE